MGLMVERGSVDHAGDEPRDRVDDDHRAELTAGEHVVADRDLFVDIALDDALVDALVVATHEHQVRQGGETGRRGLVEHRALRGKKDNVPVAASYRAYRSRQRLRFHHHSRAAAIRCIVDDVMPVAGPRPDVVYRQRHQTRLPRARDDALGEWTLEHLRKEREDVDCEAHPRSSCGVRTIRPARMSISRTTVSIIAWSVSVPCSPTTTSTSVPPARRRSRTLPSGRP